MNRLILALMMSVSVASTAMAGEMPNEKPDHEGPHAPPGGEACKEAQLTPEQKTLLKAEELKFEEKRIDLEASLKKAHLNFRKVVSDEKSDEKAIRNAAENVASEQNKMSTAEELFHAEVLIKVFKPAQRAEALNCEKFRHHHEEHEGHGGQRPDGPPDKDHKGPRE